MLVLWRVDDGAGEWGGAAHTEERGVERGELESFFNGGGGCGKHGLLTGDGGRGEL